MSETNNDIEEMWQAVDDVLWEMGCKYNDNRVDANLLVDPADLATWIAHLQGVQNKLEKRRGSSRNPSGR